MGDSRLFNSGESSRAKFSRVIFVLGLTLLIFGVIITINLQKNNNYPIEFDRNFIDSCLQSGGKKSGCECSLKYLQNNYTYEEVQRFDEQALKNNNKTPDELVEGFDNCRNK